MNYIDLVNEVLLRLREDTVDTVLGQEDAVVQLVISHVNDAKRIVEDAHTWNSQRHEWEITTVAGQDKYALEGSGNYARIEYIYGSDASQPREAKLADIKRRKAQGPANGPSIQYAANGVNDSGDVVLEFYPAPQQDGVVYSIGGHRRQADLSQNTDKLLVPSKPVIYYALAMSARERGEVGGQTAAEIFQLAKTYLSDAVALDANINDLDNIWMSV